MVRKLIFLMGVIFCFTILNVGQGIAEPIVSLNPPATGITVGVNESFGVDVWVYGNDVTLELLSFGFLVDPSDSLALVDYDGFTIDTTFYDSTFFLNEVAGFAFPGAKGDILLATLNFTSLASTGTETLTIEGNFSEDYPYLGLGYDLINPLPTVGVDTFNIYAQLQITVEAGTNPVPEPTTMVLFGIGLLGMAGISRKKRNL